MADETTQTRQYVVTTIHNGSDWAVRNATAEEIADPTEETLTLDEARELAAETAAMSPGSRWFDLSTDDDDESEREPLGEQSPELAAALSDEVGRALGLDDGVSVYPEHTGGGVYVMVVDLSPNGIDRARQLWLTREDGWLLGFYDFAADEEDEGVCLQLWLPTGSEDDPTAVARVVAGIVKRLRVKLHA